MNLRRGWRVPRAVAVLCLSAAFGLALARSAGADEAASAARAISEKNGDAVVTVRVTVKYRMVFEGEEAEEQETTSETKATVVDPSGLAVCSLAEIDPSHMMKMMAGEEPAYDFKADVTSLRLVLADGKEIPARVVLRDQDLDLAFLRPSDGQAQPFKTVDLTQAGEPQVMDELVLLSRLGEAANRALYTALDRVTAVVREPRTLYVAGIGTWVAGLGIPAFTLDGKLVGITVMRAISLGSGSTGRSESSSLPVLLPAAEILKVSRQASG